MVGPVKIHPVITIFQQERHPKHPCRHDGHFVAFGKLELNRPKMREIMHFGPDIEKPWTFLRQRPFFWLPKRVSVFLSYQAECCCLLFQDFCGSRF
ncbi:hypothetical protein A1359_16955 [Methylomonas lenta]|uniref:Uncharacterized protein n=1 Tax=Methylomonas lenta TaxID=980561 RepID=A0A177MX99_9GAMM|nr:hypothetical protein A1359_16955 [Methylomonas lenta]